MWTPDAYQGAPTPVTAFMSSATKVAALVVTYRVLVTAFPGEEHLWTWAIAAIAICSLAVGNIAALAQRNVKRLLAYSSVSHAGFMLIAIAAANETRRAGARLLPDPLLRDVARRLRRGRGARARAGVPVTLENLAGFGWERPFFGVAMWVFMLGFLGFPLTGGFWGKIYVFAAIYEHGWWWLIVIGVVATVVSAAYYLAVVRAMFLRDSVELHARAGRRLAAARARARRAASASRSSSRSARSSPCSRSIDVARAAANALPF